MKPLAIIALALLSAALPSTGHARGGPRTLSDYNIQKESAFLPPRAYAGQRHFHSLSSRARIGHVPRRASRARSR